MTEALEIEQPEQPGDNSSAIVAYKGFDANLSCRGYKFEIGASYTQSGEIRVCSNGFHACEHPLNVFDYYPAAGSRFAQVELSGQISKATDDTKIAAASISIKAELNLSELIKAAVKWVFDRSHPEEGAQATGYRGAASATGYRGAASATGYRGAASATGDSGAASATGKDSVAMACGHDGRVMAAEGCALFLVYRDPNSNTILHAWSGIAGREGIEPQAWYSLDENGQPQKVEAV